MIFLIHVFMRWRYHSICSVLPNVVPEQMIFSSVVATHT
jgi:hypothetical protein